MLGARLGLKKRARSASEEEREDKNGCEQPGGLRCVVLEGEQGGSLVLELRWRRCCCDRSAVAFHLPP